jgi:hypothetical protein
MVMVNGKWLWLIMVNGELSMVYSRYKWWFYGDLTKMINGD